MKLLVSPTNKKEAIAAIAGGADIIDVKNPREGSLGANFPWVIKEIKALLPASVELSATLGDLEFKPGTASLAAYAAASLGVDYVKAGLYGINNMEQALEIAKKICRAAATDFKAKVVLASYAEHEDIGCISPFLLSEIAKKAGASVVMIDTARKNGRSLLNHIEEEQLKKFIHKAHEEKLQAALAGSLNMNEVKKIAALGCDIVGVRSAVCRGDRLTGEISAAKVKKLKQMLGE